MNSVFSTYQWRKFFHGDSSSRMRAGWLGSRGSRKKERNKQAEEKALREELVGADASLCPYSLRAQLNPFLFHPRNPPFTITLHVYIIAPNLGNTFPAPFNIALVQAKRRRSFSCSGCSSSTRTELLLLPSWRCCRRCRCAFYRMAYIHAYEPCKTQYIQFYPSMR